MADRKTLEAHYRDVFSSDKDQLRLLALMHRDGLQIQDAMVLARSILRIGLAETKILVAAHPDWQNAAKSSLPDDDLIDQFTALD